MSDLSREAAAKGLRFNLPDARHAPTQSDPVLVSVALRNVIENAITMAPDESEIDITFDTADDRLRVCVMDRGPGIAESDRAKITDRFFRGTATGSDGSGLGLTIVKTAMNRLDGKLEFTPRPGGGEIVSLVF